MHIYNLSKQKHDNVVENNMQLTKQNEKRKMYHVWNWLIKVCLLRKFCLLVISFALLDDGDN